MRQNLRAAVLVVMAACSRPAAHEPVVETPPADAAVSDVTEATEVAELPDVPVRIDAGVPREERAKQAHDECVQRTKALEIPVVASSKTHGKPMVAIVRAGEMSARYTPQRRLHPESDFGPLLTRLAPTQAALLTCYKAALRRDPQVHGGLQLAAELDAQGSFQNVSVRRDITGDATLGTCVRDVIAKTKVENDVYGSEMYLDIGFCTADRAACVFGVEAEAAWQAPLLAEARRLEAQIGACFREAVPKRPGPSGYVVGRIDLRADGGRKMFSGGMDPFAGDDASGTVQGAASRCISRSWRTTCIDPPPLDSEPSVETSVWFP